MEALCRPIGVVRSPIAESKEMPRVGVTATIEVFPEYAEGLDGIEESSHIVVLGWMHQAERNLLRIDRPGWRGGRLRRGVFASRSPARPNPIGLATVKLVSVEGNLLRVSSLDMIDGTPVLDIKVSAPGYDGPFSARSPRLLSKDRRPDPRKDYQAMLREAENFHGEVCAGIALGVRMMYQARVAFDVGQRDPGLKVTVGNDGCIADALQALSGATLGNGRLRVEGGEVFRMSYHGRALTFGVQRGGEAVGNNDVESILGADINRLFQISQAPV